MAEHLQHSGTLGQLPPMSYFPLAPGGLVTVQPSRDGYNPSFCFRRAKHHQSQLAIESQCLSLWPTSFLRVLFLTLFISYVGLSCTRVFFRSDFSDCLGRSYAVCTDLYGILCQVHLLSRGLCRYAVMDGLGPLAG